MGEFIEFGEFDTGRSTGLIQSAGGIFICARRLHLCAIAQNSRGSLSTLAALLTVKGLLHEIYPSHAGDGGCTVTFFERLRPHASGRDTNRASASARPSGRSRV